MSVIEGLALSDLLASYDINAQISAIEDMVAQGAEMQIVVRLLCLASLTAGGVKLKALESIKREILQVWFETAIEISNT
jgi:vacuolar protein sorting-associated protein 33A